MHRVDKRLVARQRIAELGTDFEQESREHLGLLYQIL